MKPETKLTYSIQELMKKPFDIERRLKTMKNTFISADIEDIHELLGKLINRALLYEQRNAGGKIIESYTIAPFFSSGARIISFIPVFFPIFFWYLHRFPVKRF